MRYLAGLLLAVAASGALAEEAVPLRRVHWTVGPGDVLSVRLFAAGIGKPDAPLRLYGTHGWIAVTQRLNPAVRSGTDLVEGDELALLLPASGVEDAAAPERFTHEDKEFETRYEAVWLEPDETLSGALHARGVGTPGSPGRLYGSKGLISRAEALSPPGGNPWILSYPVAVANVPAEASPASLAVEPPPPPPEPTPPPPPPPPIAREEVEKLSVDEVASLGTEEVERIPEEVKEEKAWEFSIFDAMKPGMDRFLGGVGATTAAGYAGVRYGLSLAARDDELAAGMSVFSLLAEVRGGPVAGLRFYFDHLPTARANQNGEETRLGMSRALLGWAFEFEAPALVDKIHVSPKVGRYTLEARLPTAVDDEGKAVYEELRVIGAPSLGAEVDLELAAFFYVLRGWASRDFASRFGATKGSEQVTSTRLGLDAFLKGGGVFGARMSLAYLVFLVHDSLAIAGKHEDGRDFALTVRVPYAGLGLSLSW